MSEDPHRNQGQVPGQEDWTRREYDWDQGRYTEPGTSGHEYGTGPGSQYGTAPGAQYGEGSGYEYGSGPGGSPYTSGHQGDAVPGYARDMSPGDERTWAVLGHIAAPVGTLLSLGWLGFVGPLVIWLIYRDRSPFVRAAAARSFNFNLVVIVGNALAFVLAATIILLPIAILLWIGLFIAMLVFHISAALDASKGILYRYPLTFPVLH